MPATAAEQPIEGNRQPAQPGRQVAPRRLTARSQQSHSVVADVAFAGQGEHIHVERFQPSSKRRLREVEEMQRGNNPPTIVGTGQPGAIGLQVVRHLDGQQAAGLEDAPRFRQNSARIAEMLEHLEQGQHVKAGVGKRRIGQRTLENVQAELLVAHAGRCQR